MIDPKGSVSRVELELRPALEERTRVPMPTGIPMTAELALAPVEGAPVSVELGLRPIDATADRVAEAAAPVVIRGADELSEDSSNRFEFRISWTAKDGKTYSYRLPVEDPEKSQKASEAFAKIKAKHPSLNRLNLLLLIGNGIDVNGDPELAEAIKELRTIYDQIRQKNSKIDWSRDLESFEPTPSEIAPLATARVTEIRRKTFEQILQDPTMQEKLKRFSTKEQRSQVLFGFWMTYQFLDDLVKEIDAKIESKKRDLKKAQGQKEMQLKSELRELEQKRAELTAVDFFAIAYARCSDADGHRKTPEQHAQALRTVLHRNPSSCLGFVQHRIRGFFANDVLSEHTRNAAETAWIKRATLLTARTSQEMRYLHDELISPPTNSIEGALMRFLRGSVLSEKEGLKTFLQKVGLSPSDELLTRFSEKIEAYRTEFARAERREKWDLPLVVSLGTPVDAPGRVVLPESPTTPAAS